MGNDMMDLDELADYLQRDARELNKLASRGHLPGHKVSGRWRFARAEADSAVANENAAAAMASQANFQPSLIGVSRPH